MTPIKKLFPKRTAAKSSKPGGMGEKIPRHVAIIMDGNGRWAKSRNKPRTEGHKIGAKRVSEITEAAMRSGVEFLTLFAFSSENWNRPKSEIDALMNLLVISIKTHGKKLVKDRVRFRAIGNVSALPKKCLNAIEKLEEKTKNFDGRNLVLALNYGARDELVRAVRKISNSAKIGEIDPNKIEWEDVARNLDTADIPDPDLLIRTSGEMRLSNYLLMQSAYAELYFTDVCWPDFTAEEFSKALKEYGRRERRYGLTGEQILER